MKLTTILPVLLLLAVPLTAVTPGAAHPETTEFRFDRHTTEKGVDTYVLTLRSDEAFRINEKSHFIVNGTYDPNSTLQEGGAMMGIVRFHSDTNCGQCFTLVAGNSIKDAYDAQVKSDGPVQYEFNQDPNVGRLGALKIGVSWPNGGWFSGPTITQDQVTYRFFVTVPEAVQLKLNVHLHFNKDVQVHTEKLLDAGFLLADDDFASTAHVDTMAASAMVDSEATLDLPLAQDERIYLGMSPAWQGTSAVAFGLGFAAVTHNTAAYGSYGLEDPSGDVQSNSHFVFGGDSGPKVIGSQEAGTYRFFVNHQEGVGPTDMYVVGFSGDV